MKKTIRTKVFASLIAAVCPVSAITTVSMISASAYNNGNDLVSKSYVITAETYGDTFVMPIKGENWNYYADSLNVRVSCDFDYSSSMCNFKFTAVKPGVANVVLKTQKEDGKWLNTPVRITVKDNLRMTIIGTDRSYTTDHSYTTEKISNNTSESKKTSDDIKKSASSATYSLYGNDWNYYIDSLNVKVSCDFDYSSSMCNFKFTAVKPGTSNAVLKTERNDGRWLNVPVRITVDDNMEVSFYESGSRYITDSSRSV